MGSFMAVMAAAMASSRAPPFSRTLFPVRFNWDVVRREDSPSVDR